MLDFFGGKKIIRKLFKYTKGKIEIAIPEVNAFFTKVRSRFVRIKHRKISGNMKIWMLDLRWFWKEKGLDTSQWEVLYKGNEIRFKTQEDLNLWHSAFFWKP